jgi:transcription elongation factor GreA
MQYVDLTAEKLAQLKQKLDTYIASRPDAVADLQKARSLGDLSENGYYKAARAKLSEIDRLIRHTRMLIVRSRIIQTPTSGKIGLGSRVTLSTGKEMISYRIVGPQEANPSDGLISHMSPLGSLMLGKQKNDAIVLNTPKGQTTYLIISVE